MDCRDGFNVFKFPDKKTSKPLICCRHVCRKSSTVFRGDARGARAPPEFWGLENGVAKPDFCLLKLSYYGKHLWIWKAIYSVDCMIEVISYFWWTLLIHCERLPCLPGKLLLCAHPLFLSSLLARSGSQCSRSSPVSSVTLRLLLCMLSAATPACLHYCCYYWAAKQK